ncbi:GatB/YqeY domain-containing protein [Parvularcula lutaonensis]|uniref:GatB/YqeY domain-containing protein n=1 Tax=Parvularcula lutaonensis TaxID=491923 RepID=A0ABV7MD84_9PROT|nr:GatB/YqeY domain-containing protein [Parvularcula lutaonensis]GGY39996.1 aspartyl-tRNA amidotransferase subunit B [Parvularcula lutaonensis]
MSEQGHLAKQIATDLKAAMKARDDKVRISTLRLMQAAIKDRDIQARSEDRCCGLSDDEVREVLTKMVKQRQDSARTYEEAGRIEMAEQERAEIDVIRGYLPKQMSESEIENAVDSVIAEIGAEGLKDMGKCMGALKQNYAGRMDFSAANKLVKARLG